ncbi:uncharacterized protein LOC107045167 [Diachasma alloeum]|uniref:uncharacterized protein LOC107045167 n=1 Tax=Diachasma alloeum TaxID=454923 RepID=UPI0007381BB7|nr:uncharacterized protein LOC107045167 [Diachasma alloeum]
MNTVQLYKPEKSTANIEQMINTLLEASTAAQYLQEDVSHLAIIPLIIAYFKEDLDFLYKIVVEAMSKEDLEQLITNPTQILVVKGESLYDPIASYTVFIEQREYIYRTHALQGFLIVFLAYFVFGVKYPHDLDTSLEFIQKVFLDIDIPEGKENAFLPSIEQLSDFGSEERWCF